jgi:hypothetical protein
MNDFNEQNQAGAGPTQPGAAAALPFLDSDELDDEGRYFSDESLAMRGAMDNNFLDNDDALDCLAPFETDTWRAVDIMAAGNEAYMGFDTVVEMPSALHVAAPAKSITACSWPNLSGLDALPLPPLPALPAASISVFGAGSAGSASSPQAYSPPSVTCWTAFESADADQTVGMLERFVNAKGAKLTRRNYTLTVTDGDMRAVSLTSAHHGCFTTTCRRLSGDSVLFNSLFQELLAGVAGAKPTVCYSAGCKEEFMQTSLLNPSSSTNQHVK